MPITPKYRVLTEEELTSLESEFVQFLASNGITADDWVKMKGQDRNKVNGLITLFSDIVLDNVLGKINLLEKRSKHSVQLFQISDDRIILRGIEVDPNHSIDFTRPEIKLDVNQLHEEKKSTRLVRGEKKIADSRQLHTFRLLQEGALISHNQALFDTLENLSAGKQK